MADLISANDLHDAADDPLMLPGGNENMSDREVAKKAAEKIGLELNAIGSFLASSNFAWPHGQGVPHKLHQESVAYGICLGLVAAKRAAE